MAWSFVLYICMHCIVNGQALKTNVNAYAESMGDAPSALDHMIYQCQDVNINELLQVHMTSCSLNCQHAVKLQG